MIHSVTNTCGNDRLSRIERIANDRALAGSERAVAERERREALDALCCYCARPLTPARKRKLERTCSYCADLSALDPYSWA